MRRTVCRLQVYLIKIRSAAHCLTAWRRTELVLDVKSIHILLEYTGWHGGCAVFTKRGGTHFFFDQLSTSIVGAARHGATTTLDATGSTRRTNRWAAYRAYRAQQTLQMPQRHSKYFHRRWRQVQPRAQSADRHAVPSLQAAVRTTTKFRAFAWKLEQTSRLKSKSDI